MLSHFHVISFHLLLRLFTVMGLLHHFMMDALILNHQTFLMIKLYSTPSQSCAKRISSLRSLLGHITSVKFAKESPITAYQSNLRHYVSHSYSNRYKRYSTVLCSRKLSDTSFSTNNDVKSSRKRNSVSVTDPLLQDIELSANNTTDTTEVDNKQLQCNDNQLPLLSLNSFNIADEYTDYKHIKHLKLPGSMINEYWMKELLKISTFKACDIIQQLVSTNALGYNYTGKQALVELALQAKTEYPDKLILIRNGDFYETFGIDAIMLIGKKCMYIIWMKFVYLSIIYMLH